MKTDKPRQRSETVTRPFPLRLTLSQIDDVLSTATKCSQSGNTFMVRAILATMEMIKAPYDKDVPLPEFLATARHSYHYEKMKDKPVIKG